MKPRNLSIATFNVRGLTDEIKQQQLSLDIVNYGIDFACLQETKIQDGVDVNIGQCRLITLKTECKHYGLGFIFNRKWNDSIHKVWKISDRIAVLQIITHNKRLVTIINVYGPTSVRAAQDLSETEQLYDDLSTITTQLKNKTTFLVCGDFNAKVGKRRNTESCLGNYSRGLRNSNGQFLVDFCDSNGLFIANTSFRHKASHITTWQGRRLDRTSGEIVPIYNQIDYIICHTNYKKFLNNARSYSGTLTFSDHRLVIAVFEIEWHRVWSNNKHDQPEERICLSKLVNDENTQKEYNKALQNGLDSIRKEERNDSISWEEVKDIIKNAAKTTLGSNKKTNKTPNRTFDEIIIKLSEEQKKLRLQIESCNNPSQRQVLKETRNKILHKISTEVKERRNKELDKKAEEINNLPDHAQMFGAVKTLNRKRYENPQIHDEEGKIVTNINQIQSIIHKHFESKFRQDSVEDIKPFEGEPRGLCRPITITEVREALKKLNNNRACGEDGIYGELLKYGSESLGEILTSILNDIFSNHDDININNGLIIALQKPGKPKGPVTNLRPITLLNTLRKVLSIIVLKRTRHNVDAYLDLSQSGFREGRSTADIVWAHRWLVSKVYAEDLEIFITGIDMSSAFDTISRHLLLDILRDIIKEDELRMTRYLLSNTDLSIKLKNSSKTDNFTSNIGTPQGDSLSPVLFVIYLENALRGIRQQPQNSTDDFELAYADDVDFVSSTGFKDVEEVQKHLADVNLLVNNSKTEFTTIQRSENEHWRKAKKVGSLLGDNEDICRRKQLSNAALHKLTALWIRTDKIKKQTRLKLYRALVKSVLLYNCGTWALTKQEEHKLNTFHRKHLRTILNIKYPTKITNKSLYSKTDEVPIALTILEARWRLFGHILRQDPNTPANKVMIKYFHQEATKRKGRPKTSIVSTLRQDLKRLSHTAWCNKLNTISDLEHLRQIAKDRTEWRYLVSKLYRAAQAEESDDTSADGP